MPKAIFSPSANTFISQYYPEQNYNCSYNLFVGQFRQSGDIYRSLLRFGSSNSIAPLNQIPSASIINEAILQLAIEKNEIPSGASVRLNVFSIVQPWDSRVVIWNNQPLFQAVCEGSVTITPEYATVEVDLTSLVRDWLEGNIYNQGILLTGDESRNRLISFHSSFCRNGNLWPRLSVNFTTLSDQ